MPTSKQDKTQPMNRTVEGELTVVDSDNRQIEMSISSEAPYKRWFGNEILSHEPGAVDLSRVAECCPLFFAHGRDANFGVLPIGKPDSVWFEGNKLKALVTFDDDEKSDIIFKKVEKGLLKGVSVGYHVVNWETVSDGTVSANGRFSGPCEVATLWELLEISIEPTPADSTVGVGRNINDENFEGEKIMSITRKASEQPVASAPPHPVTPTVASVTQTKDQDETLLKAVESERARTVEIGTLCRTFEVDPSPYISGGQSIDQVRTAIIDTLAENKKAVSNVQVTDKGEENYRRDVSDGLAIRAGLTITGATADANRFRNMSLRDIAVQCVERLGDTAARSMDSDELFKRALSPTSAFSSILDTSINKSMANAVETYRPTFLDWTGTGSVKDFKESKHYQLAEAGELLPLRENGEFSFDEIKDQGIRKSITTRGLQFGFTRESMINDDIDIIGKVPQKYVAAYYRGINDLVYKMLCSNPVMYDGNQLFCTEHGNIAAQADKITTALFSEMKKLMRKQKDISKKAFLNLTPAFVIAPSSLEVDIQQFLLSTSAIDGANSGILNVFKNSMTPIIDATLDGYSEKKFYMATNSNLCDTIEVTYLNGKKTPTLESAIDWKRLGIEYRIYADVGVNLLDYKGLVEGSVR